MSRGKKQNNTLLTKIRIGHSDLKQHRYTIGLSDSPQCLCHHREESPLHYFIDCFLYSPERQTLFSRIEHYIPNFPNFTKQRKLEILLRGIHIDNPDFLSLNTTLTILVQNFIILTKRFSWTSPSHPPPPSTPVCTVICLMMHSVIIVICYLLFILLYIFSLFITWKTMKTKFWCNTLYISWRMDWWSILTGKSITVECLLSFLSCTYFLIYITVH